MPRTFALLFSLLFLVCCTTPVVAENDGEIKSPLTGTSFVTAKDTDLRLSQNASLEFFPFEQPLETQPCIFIDQKREFQTFIGIGAAITDAAAETFFKLPDPIQQQIVDDYFNLEGGIGYTFLRTHIASCDFSSEMYDYVDRDDKNLATFDIGHDLEFRIPMIKRAAAAIEKSGGKMNLCVSPWSPPAWMKTTDNRLQGGKLKPEFRDAWANHYVKFIQAYQSQGIPVWGLTPQNEPMAKQTWESCIYTAAEERDFVRDHLGPALHKAGMGDKKIVMWDHNRDLIYQRVKTMMDDKEAAKYVWGAGFHWYEPWTGGDMQFENLRQVKRSFPDLQLMFTEGCVEKYDAARIDDWTLGERYGHSMVNDFKCGAVSWVDWNILLDQTGGPNHVGNFCFSPMHGNTSTGQLKRTNSYFYIGQFSKFVRQGAVCIASSSSRDSIRQVCFRNPDGTIVLVVLNRTETDQDFKICLDQMAAEAISPKRSISTFLISNAAVK